MNVIVIIFAILFAVPVFAQEAKQEGKKPFTIDFTQTLIGLDGKPLSGPGCQTGQVVGKDCKALTLGEAVGIAFSTPIESDRNSDFNKKYADGQLAHSVEHNAAAVLTSEQITTIKERLGKVFMGANVAYAAGPLLDPSLK